MVADGTIRERQEVAPTGTVKGGAQMDQEVHQEVVLTGTDRAVALAVGMGEFQMGPADHRELVPPGTGKKVLRVVVTGEDQPGLEVYQEGVTIGTAKEAVPAVDME